MNDPVSSPLNPDGAVPAPDVRRYFQDKARKQPKRARTRATILDGVIETIAQNGLEGTTVREIAESAGISHGTFYNHFQSREDAIRVAASSVAAEILSTLAETIKHAKREDEAIAAVAYAFMAAAIRRPSWAKTLADTVSMLDASLDPATERLEMLIDRGYSNGVFRVSATPLLSLQVRAIQALTISEAESSADPDAALRETCEAILRLLGRTPKEAKATVDATVRRLT